MFEVREKRNPFEPVSKPFNVVWMCSLQTAFKFSFFLCALYQIEKKVITRFYEARLATSEACNCEHLDVETIKVVIIIKG